ncbi:MAG: choice-of-anchor Q domain-containing protein [Rhodanobacteraceae bacterium]
MGHLHGTFGARAAATWLGLALAGIGSAHAALCYVDAGAVGGNGGDSWANAYTDLRSALGNLDCSEIWVAEGVYKPGTAQSDNFVIGPGVAVYGGFVGTETVRDERNPDLHITVLSADIDANDINVDGNHIDENTDDIRGNNAWHVATMDGVTGTPVLSNTVLDGFVITAGDASSAQFPDSVGGGLLCYGIAAGHECSPTLANLVFSGNYAEYGGAIYDNGDGGASSPQLTRIVFSGNGASNSGGAIYNNGRNSGTSSPTLTDVLFSGNMAEYGGALVNSGEVGGFSSPIVSRATFSGNVATYAGAVYNDGQNGTSRTTLTNVTFSDNRATFGGAVIDNGVDGGLCAPIFTNVTFNGNGSDFGGAIYTFAVGGTSIATLSNTILWGDSVTNSGAEIYNDGGMPTIRYSIVQGGVSGDGIDNRDGGSIVDGGGNLDADPVLDPLQNNGGFTPTLALQEGSAAIDTGDDANCPATDQRGVARPQRLHCDIGAFELRYDRIFSDGFDASP